MSVAAMGPLLGALSVAPLIASQAGFSTPFIFLVSWIAMFAVALTIGRFCSVLPGAASIYSYITHGLGERTGFLTTWLSFSYYLLFVPLLLAAIGIYGEAMATDVLKASIDWWIWSLLAAAIVTTLAIVGIGLSMRIDLTLAVICDGFLLLISLIIIGKVIGDGDFTLAPLSPSHAPVELHRAVAGAGVRDPDLPRLRAVLRARRGGQRSARQRARRRSTRRWRWSAACCSSPRSR